MAKKYIAIALLVLGSAGCSSEQATVPIEYYNDIHPTKVAQAKLYYQIYTLKQRVASEAEAEFWNRNYEESARAQRIWEQKAWNSANIMDKL